MRPETFVHVIYVKKEKKTKFSKSNQALPKEINAMNILKKLTFNCVVFFKSKTKARGILF